MVRSWSRTTWCVAVLLLLSVLPACGAAEDAVVVEADRRSSPWAFARAGTGQDVVFGALTVRNRGDDPATLTAARLTGPDGVVADAGARILDVMVRDVTGGRELVGAARWPFEDFARGAVPLDEYRLEPGHRVELLVVVRVEDSGHWFWPDTEVSWRYDDEDHVSSVSTGFLICPPDLTTPCDPPPSLAP